MAKFSISLQDDLYQKLEEVAKNKNDTVSGIIAEALQVYFSAGSTATSTPKQTS